VPILAIPGLEQEQPFFVFGVVAALAALTFVAVRGGLTQPEDMLASARQTSSVKHQTSFITRRPQFIIHHSSFIIRHHPRPRRGLRALHERPVGGAAQRLHDARL
jgi:hypothetical protein